MGKTVPRPLKITVTLSEDTHPDLTRALMTTRKGPSRTARLTSLAYLGLIVERNGLSSIPKPTLPVEKPVTESIQPSPMPTGYQPMLDEHDVEDLFTGLDTTQSKRH
jgi:hypothetical protein